MLFLAQMQHKIEKYSEIYNYKHTIIINNDKIQLDTPLQ
jgi:hypothetical protein